MAENTQRAHGVEVSSLGGIVGRVFRKLVEVIVQCIEQLAQQLRQALGSKVPATGYERGGDVIMGYRGIDGLAGLLPRLAQKYHIARFMHVTNHVRRS